MRQLTINEVSCISGAAATSLSNITDYDAIRLAGTAFGTAIGYLSSPAIATNLFLDGTKQVSVYVSAPFGFVTSFVGAVAGLYAADFFANHIVERFK